MYIKTEIIGRLTKDPEFKVLQKEGTDLSLVNFTVACDIGFGASKKTEFVNCTAWRKTADAIAKVCQKGMLVHVVAVPNTEKYDIEKEGVKFKVSSVNYNVESINFLSKGKGAEEEGSDQAPVNLKAPF